MENKIELISASVSDRGLSEKRPQNEDSFAELPQFGVFAVADGVGGAQAGDFASQMAMELLTEAVSHKSDSADAEELFRVAIEHANRSIYQMAADVPQLSSMATTIVALHLKGNIATLAHVGDSRIYRFSPDGQGFRETNDHSVVEEEVRAGRMTPEEAAIHPSRNVISRALGAEEHVDIDIKTIMVEPNTTFLLCSDGITRHIPDDELQTIFASGAQPELICNHLKEVCYSRGAEDNLTAVIVRTFVEPADDIVNLDATVPVMEEETVASARTAYAAVAGDTIEINADDTIANLDIDEVETGEFPADPAVNGEFQESESSETEDLIETPQIVEPLASDDTDEQYLMSDTDDAIDVEATEETLSSYTSSSVVVPAQTKESEPEFAMFGSQAADKELPPKTSGPGGRILISIGLLALGALIAIGATYLLGFAGKDEPVTPPQVETMKTQNIPLTSFEESRRSVDKDPEGYQRANTVTPRDASDHYLLGRAMLLTDKTDEARSQLALAQQKLPQVDEAERKTLANEIALAMAVVENPQAIGTFKKSIADTSAPANTAAPIR